MPVSALIFGTDFTWGYVPLVLPVSPVKAGKPSVPWSTAACCAPCSRTSACPLIFLEAHRRRVLMLWSLWDSRAIARVNASCPGQASEAQPHISQIRDCLWPRIQTRPLSFYRLKKQRLKGKGITDVFSVWVPWTVNRTGWYLYFILKVFPWRWTSTTIR